jgi:hypothetical protein
MVCSLSSAALVQHITGLDVQDAAQFLAPKEATVPQKPEGRKQPASPSRKSTPLPSLPS